MTAPWEDKAGAAVQYARLLICMLLAALLVAPTASARTWTVGVLGTIGVDFIGIKPAVDAAAPGDTILIGPGRYDQLHNVVAPGWTEEVIVPVTKDNLTFIGAGAGRTIIGKFSLYVPPGRAPKAFCSIEAHDVLIKGMTIENMRTGIYWYRGNLNVEDCEFRGSLTAMTFWVDGGRINNCMFDVSGDILALAIGETIGIDISNCRFFGYGQGLGTMGSAYNVNFTDCVFEGNRSALGYDNRGTGHLRNVTISGTTSIGIAVTYNSELTLEGVTIGGGDYGIYTSSGSRVIGASVVVESTDVASLYASSEAVVSISDSHMLAGSGWAVRCNAYVNASVVLNLGHNYWGTTDQAAIDNMIFDFNDDPSVRCTVQYVPYANGPVPTETTTWGDLKALWR